MSHPTISDFEKLNFLIESGHIVSVLEHIRNTKITPTVDLPDYPLGQPLPHSPVYVAARWGRVEIMQALIDIGFNYITAEPDNVFNEYLHLYPIHIAAVHGHVAVVKFLVEQHGVSVDSEEERTPLWFAIRGGQLNVVRYLMDQGASITDKMPYPYNTPLQLAIASGHSDICECLTSHGADVNGVDEFGRSNLLIAILYGNVDTLRVLIDSVNDDMINNPSLFFIATSWNKLDMLKLLYSRGTDPNLVGNTSRTVLSAAIQSKNLNIARYIVVDLNMRRSHESGEDHQTDYIKLALTHYAYDIAKLLIKAGFPCTYRHYHLLEELCDAEMGVGCQEVLSFTRQAVAIPSSLEQLTCWRVRDVLGGNISRADSLPLPRKLVNLITLTHI